MKISLAITLFCFIVCSLCCAGTIDPNTPDDKYIQYGQKFSYIGLILGQKTDDSRYSGSAVATKDRIIITAAHLFHESKQASIMINNKLIPIKIIVVHNNYDYNKFGKYDIAICLLSSSIDLEWYPDIYDDTNESGKICSLAGYGATGDFLTGARKSDGSKRAGSNIIDSSDPFLLFCSPSVRENKTELEFLIASGDSGGGLFIGNKLAGIHSGTIEEKKEKGKSKYGSISVHTRVSSHKDWIRETISRLINYKE
jgi:hypothetical protein